MQVKNRRVQTVKMEFHVTASQKTPDGFQEGRGRGKQKNYPKLLQKQRRHKVKKKSLRTNQNKKVKKKKQRNNKILSSWQRPRWHSAKKDPGVGVGLEKVKFLIWISCVVSRSKIKCYKKLREKGDFCIKGSLINKKA